MTYTTFERDNSRVIVTHDESAENPFSWGWEGLAVIPYDRQKIDSGDLSLRDEMDDWQEDRDRLLMDVEDSLSEWQARENDYLDARMDPTAGEDECETRRRSAVEAQEWLSNALSDLAGHDDSRPDILVFDWFGEYTVYCDVDKLIACGGVERKFARDLAESYAQIYDNWANGGVFCISVEDISSGIETNFTCGVIFPDDCPTDDEIWKYLTS